LIKNLGFHGAEARRPRNSAFGAPKERTQASSVRAWPPGLLRRDGGERTHGRKRGGETGGERRVEPAKEKLGETVDGAPAWLRKETKKTRRGKFLAPRGATWAATTDDAAAATSARVVAWAWCHPPSLFSHGRDREVHRILGVVAVGPRSCSLFPFWGRRTKAAGPSESRRPVGQPPSWGLWRRIATLTFGPYFFFI